jgi:hypothetical protein
MKDAEWIDLLESIQVDRQVAADFLVMRKAKKAPLTMTALKRIQAEATKSESRCKMRLSSAAHADGPALRANGSSLRNGQNL